MKLIRGSVLWLVHKVPTPICLPIGVICDCDGPPTPLTGPASPAGADIEAEAAGIPRPAARAIPGPLPPPGMGTLGPCGEERYKQWFRRYKS